MKCPKCGEPLDLMVRVQGFEWYRINEDGSVDWNEHDQELNDDSVRWVACQGHREHLFSIEQDENEVIHLVGELESEPPIGQVEAVRP